MNQQWQPTASIENLKKRAKIIAQIRHFFAERDVLEVDTPALSHATVTDPYLHSITANCKAFNNTIFYLQTSPEYAMKRLLAANSGPIYQICKAFRDDEIGRHHNPEFTILEWYRPGFDHHDLMNEMDELLKLILNVSDSKKYSYQELFEKYFKINPHTTSLESLRDCALKNGISDVSGKEAEDKDIWLQLLMSEVIEPKLKTEGIVFIYNYPTSQASLSRINKALNVAERFEVYIDGLELANGFHELAQAEEQHQRFENDLIKRRKLGYEEPPIDELFVDALRSGFPNCSGVALGVDRLIMLALHKAHIEEVIAFPIDRA